MMYRLLEKLIEDVTRSLSIWLTPKGREESIIAINHGADAVERLAKLRGEEVPDTTAISSKEIERGFYEFMKVSGYIRLYLSTFSDELAISVGGRITPIQLTKIGKLAREYSKTTWEVVNPHWGSPKMGSGFREFANILKDYKLLEKILQESSIDFPYQDPDDAIWDKEDDLYTLREDVKAKILAILEKYPDVPLLEIAEEIHIVGSLCTNQFLDTADCDVHIVPKNAKEWNEEETNKVIRWFNENRDEIGGWIEEHPIEVYIQLNPNQDLMSDGCYNLLSDEWLVGPKIVPISSDPYEDFSHIADDIRNTVEDADKLFGELKRDVIDFEVIEIAMERMSGEDKDRLLQKLQDKLDELEDDIEALYKEKGEWTDARRGASKPETPEQALKDVELAKNWKDVNATFKFVNRYRYMRTIKNLKELLADEEITPDEVEKIKSIMGV